MNKMIARGGMTLALIAITVGSVMAAPPKKAPKKAGASCPVCHMPLSTKMSKSSSVAVKLTPKGKTLYCCTKCTMPESVLVKPKKGKM